MSTASTTRASHVNSGTALEQAQRDWKTSTSRVYKNPKVTVETERSDTTRNGGLAFASAMVKRLGLAQFIDERVEVLRQHRPFHESDHVLTHVAMRRIQSTVHN